MRVATIRKDQKLSEILYRFAADAKLPSEYESFVAGEKTGVVRIQRDEAGNRIREDYLTVGGTLTRYETYSYSPEHVEDVHYAADGKKTGYYDLYYSAKDTLIRAIYYFITDPWYTDTEFDDGTGRTKSKKEFKDGKLKATVSCTYNADGDLSRCDTDIYDAALHWYATEEFNDDLPTKRTYKEANGATKEVQFKYDEKRWLKESALYYEGVFVCRFVYDRLPDGTVKRTLALGPNGEPWAEYPDMEITNVQRNGEAPAGKSIIHKTGNWWNPSSSEHKQESKSSVTVSIFPHPNMEVPVGGSQVVTATIDGSTNTAVKWSISGSGCSGSACGTVSAGLYLAPSILPNPPTVKLTATSEADPNASDSIAVQIGHSTLTSAWKQDDGNASFGLGPVLRVGGGVSAPHAVYAPDPEY